jgi:hypothetical protein
VAKTGVEIAGPGAVGAIHLPEGPMGKENGPRGAFGDLEERGGSTNITAERSETDDRRKPAGSAGKGASKYTKR